MGIFNKNNNNQPADLPKEVRRFNSAIFSAYIAIACTVINIVGFLLNWDSYFLFSFTFPYAFFDPTDIIGSVLAAFFVILVLAFAFFAKKKPGLMVGLLVMVIIDSIFLALGILAFVESGELGGMAMDIIFHLWLLVDSILGVNSIKDYKKYKEFSEVETNPEAVQPLAESEVPTPANPYDYSDRFDYGDRFENKDEQ